jgi:peptide deformylase
MAILTIIKEPNELLHKKPMPVIQFDKTLEDFAYDMLETTKAENGIGLASIQVIDDARFKFDSIPDGFRAQPSLIVNLEASEPIFAVNPEILEHSEEVFSSTEGCLSVNEIVTVKRFKNIVVKYQDLSGKEYIKEYKNCQKNYEGLVFQHEIDHLSGITIWTKAQEGLNPMQRLLFLKKVAQMNKK